MTKAKKPARRGKAGTSKRSADEKRTTFAEAYLANGGNATEAALTAGYSKSGAAVQGCRMLKDAKVRALLSKRTTETLSTIQISTDRILLERARMAFFDPRKLFDTTGAPIPIHMLDDDTAAVIAGLDVLEEFEGTGKDRKFIGYTKKYKLADKNASLVSLEKQLGMYKADNEQVANPLQALLEALGGNVVGPGGLIIEGEAERDD